jgi:predicted AAA+ superfamily ATPase
MHPLIAAELKEDFSLEKSMRLGCLPMAYTQANPEAYLKSYVGTYIREEVLQEGLTRNIAAFSRFLEVASFAQGQPLNMAAVARDCQLSAKLVAEYFTILEDLLLAVRIPVFSRRAKRKLLAHNKFFYFDSGVFSTIKPRGPLDSQSELQGAALETLFLQQLRAVNDYFGLGYNIYYWHTHNDLEIDFVIYGERGLHAFEIKSSERVSSQDLKSLKQFHLDYPEATPHLLYAGNREFHEDGIEIRSIENFIAKLEENI